MKSKMKEVVNMLKKVAVSIALAVSCVLVFTVSAAGISSGSAVSPQASAAVTSTTPTSGNPSPDPTHGAGINNTDRGGQGMKPMASGLIGDVSLDISYISPTSVAVDVITDGTGIMDKIGANNISVQRWDDNGSWVNMDVRNGYDINTSMYGTSYYVNNLPADYLYRATCTHFATKNILFIPQTQTINNATDYIYVGYTG